ncbi:MAG TPA: glycosyltransferase [Longimicrobiales bacterium]|nr:glycosyltransferase [Longimicrobiales bacterium]
MNLSIILPTYNEAENIVPLVRALMSEVPKGLTYEIIVVDDDSPDGTFQAVRDAFPGPPVVSVLRTEDRGLARSIRAGMERSTGKLVLVMDTDFTHDPGLLPTMLHLGRAYDVVVGSRFCPGGGMQDVPHYLASMAYNWMLRVLLRTQIQDSLSGFFTIRRGTLERLPFDEIFFGYGDYFFRLLFYVQRRGASVIEMPVVYDTRRKGRSKSVFWKLVFSYSAAALKLRLRGTAVLRSLKGDLPGAWGEPELIGSGAEGDAATRMEPDEGRDRPTGST